MDHGNLTSNQVILYQEIQFPGMDVVFYVYPYTLPVYPHPASQQFPFLIHSPSQARGPHVLSEEVRPRRAFLNHLSRMSQDISHWHQWIPHPLWLAEWKGHMWNENKYLDCIIFAAAQLLCSRPKFMLNTVKDHLGHWWWRDLYCTRIFTYSLQPSIQVTTSPLFPRTVLSEYMCTIFMPSWLNMESNISVCTQGGVQNVM